MVVIEMREAAYSKVFDLLYEIKDLDKKKKIALCELEDAIYECYEASKDEEEYESPEEDQYEDEEQDINFRRSGGMRRSMRSMRSHNEEFDGESGAQMRGYRSRRNMRRRNRMGQYM